MAKKSKYENALLKTIMKKSKYLSENFGEEEEAGITAEQKRSFTEAVGNYHTIGENVYRNSSLREITEQLAEIVRVAESLTLQESEHWFDNVTTSRHMKGLKESFKVFEKTANEVHTLQQRLESAYEDMGGTLNKYYKISEALKEEETEVEEDLNISSKAFKRMNHNKISKLAKNTDINIED
jgi:hypothetical protein